MQAGTFLLAEMTDYDAVTQDLEGGRFRIRMNYSRQLRNRRSRPIEVGFLLGAPSPMYAAKTLRIRFVYVGKEWRRQRLGTRLMCLAAQKARQDDFSLLSLENALTGGRTNPFYRKLGFEFVPNRGDEMVCPVEQFKAPTTD